MSQSIRTEIIINASKEKVWEVLTDFDKYSQWNPFIIDIQGKAVAGGRLRNTMLNGNSKMVFKPQVLRVEEYYYFDWLGNLMFKSLFEGHHRFEIEELSPSQVKLNHGESFSGILSGIILKKIGDDTRQSFIKMNQALKQVAEAHAVAADA
jgi:hypothetical protein